VSGPGNNAIPKAPRPSNHARPKCLGLPTTLDLRTLGLATMPNPHLGLSTMADPQTHALGLATKPA